MGNRPAPDTIPSANADITISPITHGTVQIAHGSHVILVDPTTYAGYDGAGRLRVNFEGLKPPTLILVTDVHGDHFDPEAIAALRVPTTKILAPPAVAKDIPGATAIANSETSSVDGVTVEAVPMYNLERGYHEKGRGNGYVVTVGSNRIYFAGDTECTAEMKALMDIDIAFVPMNLPYTMTPAEAAECVKAFKPKLVYPYHYRGQNVQEFATALEGTGTDVRLRDWYVGAR
jgi:L-ascorbate metabolism protein UlaG (beta-lactamase superfamily)